MYTYALYIYIYYDILLKLCNMKVTVISIVICAISTLSNLMILRL